MRNYLIPDTWTKAGGASWDIPDMWEDERVHQGHGPGSFPNEWVRDDDPNRVLNFAGWQPGLVGEFERHGSSYYRFTIFTNLSRTFEWKFEEAAPDGRLYRWVPKE